MVALGVAHSAALVVDPKQLSLSQTETAPTDVQVPCSYRRETDGREARGRTCSTEHGAFSLGHPATEQWGWGLTRGLWLHGL